MDKLIKKSIAETAKLPEAELAEVESERRWDDLSARSQDLLARMAEEARREYRVGLTESLANLCGTGTP